MTGRHRWAAAAVIALSLTACSTAEVETEDGIDGIDAVAAPVPEVEESPEVVEEPEAPASEPTPSPEPTPEVAEVSEEDALAAATVRASEQDCDDGPGDGGGHQVVARLPGSLLVHVVCFVGAYQTSGELLVWDGVALEVVPVEQWQFGEVLEGNAVVGFVDEGPTDLSPDGVQVTNDVKYRGLGDCGLFQRWVFTGDEVLLDLAREQECSDDGEFVPPDQWPVVYER